MLFFPLPGTTSAAVARTTAIVAGLALAPFSPASAQEAVGCGVLCGLQGYLSADHMVAPLPEAAPAPAGARHASAGGHRATVTAKPRAVGGPAARDVIAARPVEAERHGAPRRASPASSPAPVKAAQAAHPAAAETRAIPQVFDRVGPHRATEHRLTTATAHPTADRTRPATSTALSSDDGGPAGRTTTRTASLPTPVFGPAPATIPGSAPAMQAGFH